MAAAVPVSPDRDIHRMGGASVANLRLKPQEAALKVPGVSVIKAPSPGEAARQMRTVFPKAKSLHQAAKTVGSTSEALIRGAGFDIMHAPSKALPNHYRIIQPQGASGFNDQNLARLAAAFVNTTGH